MKSSGLFFDKREDEYEKVADLIVDVSGRSPKMVAIKIKELIKDKI